MSKKSQEINPGAFWGKQPVPQSENETEGLEDPTGRAIDKEKDPQRDIRQEPYPLPKAFEWYSCDINDPKEVRKALLSLIDTN
jgi:glycylpeptide N-tetradecanoyltransferase